jgi:3-hydroxyacyl-[acyl-carrier-protein] dehydratase
MRFALVDRIVSLKPGASITTIKTLSLAEEYLADHFPRFPVMPGVMMLESMTQAGAWLIRVSDDFAHSLITLKQARNLRFRNFVSPGQVLTVSANILEQSPNETHLQVQGKLADSVAVTGRLVLQKSNLVDCRPELSGTDDYVKRNLREMLSLIYRPSVDGLNQQDGSAAVAGIEA